MKWIDCPTCDGKREIPFVPLSMIGGSIHGGKLKAPIPCPTCTDSDGNPTGVVWVGSRAEIGIVFMAAHEGIRFQRRKKNWETAEEWTQAIRPFERYLRDAELSHRKG